MSKWIHLSKALTHRLLPSRNPFEAKFKQLLVDTPTLHVRTLNNRAHLDLFTDGSCWTPELPWASVGAWAVGRCSVSRLTLLASGEAVPSRLQAATCACGGE